MINRAFDCIHQLHQWRNRHGVGSIYLAGQTIVPGWRGYRRRGKKGRKKRNEEREEEKEGENERRES